MTNPEVTISEADILDKVVAPNEPGLSPEAARSLLDLHFNEDAAHRMRELMDRNNKGNITDAERSEMDKYLRVGTFLDLIQAKARVSLQQSGSSE